MDEQKLPFVVRKTENKGFGLFATKDLNAGDEILVEEPLVSCQFAWNKLYKYLACDYCMKSLETAESMSQRLTENRSLSLPHPECCERNVAITVQCPQCEITYCSTSCRDKAFTEYHQILCPHSQYCSPEGLEQLDETWRNIHYPPETATVWLLAKIMTRVKMEKNKAEFISYIEEFCHQCKNESEEIVHKLLGDQFKDQLHMLREQLKSLFYSDDIAHWFTVEGFEKLFALLGTNQQGIGSSALSVWVHNCDNLDLPDGQRDQLDTFIDKLYEDLEKVSGSFLNCEGAGLYRVQSKCNHSCAPNAEVSFLHNDHRLTVKAINDVAAGEEITISYLSECELNRSRHSRQKHLRENYLFTCWCKKCQAQNGDPDVTSDEDSEDDMDDT
uniref:Protein-lysine N-trimethyltransferase SMYD5 n=1 Tax=Phallusia mammillata TaxID=59560 RepID=A0A6F9DTF3_9ASCI|nr:SET and MYND domain-containing protein 5 [Phallusia mammillata]